MTIFDFYKADDFKLEKFYSYTSIVTDVIAKSGHGSSTDDYGRTMKKFFEFIIEQAHTLKPDMNFKDNKTAFKLYHVPSGKHIFIGYYDQDYYVGLGVYMAGAVTYDFITKEKSSYIFERKYEY